MLLERVTANQVYLVLWPTWIALTRHMVGRRSLGGARRQAEMTDQGTADSQRRADGMVRNARPTIALRHFHLVYFY